jgi:trehalose 6-phosphate synthase/phosphatase
MLQPMNRKSRSAIGNLIVVSNRLPVVMTEDDAGQWRGQSSTGGLVTALSPVLRNSGGQWIGWPGTLGDQEIDASLSLFSRDQGFTLKPVQLSEYEFEQYYQGFSNEILWPLFHDLQSRCNFDPGYWNAYQTVNRKFAQVVSANANTDDYIWVQDYHLMLVARELRAIGLEGKVGFFLHTPFPPLDLYMKLPWRMQILEGLLDYDLVGFQTLRDRNNFIQCVEALGKGFHVDARRQVPTIATPDREVKVGSFPIGIDFKEFVRQSSERSVVEEAERLRAAIAGHWLILGVDRLDYSKGIPERLRAFRNALERFEDLRGNVSLVQVVVPSRENIPEYQRLKAEVEGLVGEINGAFTQPGWIPIHYVYRSLERAELLAYYRAADIALVTPLKDGMNLIAKEYCAASVEGRGVLILSEFAGAASQLRGKSLLVNPYDIEGVADAIYHACTMTRDECRIRMKRCRSSIASRDIFWWVDSFLRAASPKETNDLR